MRPPRMRLHSSEPIAIPIVKTVRNRVTTSLLPAQRKSDIGRELRQVNRPGEPEPRNPEHRPKQDLFARGFADDAPGGGKQVPLQRAARRRRAGCRDRQARRPGGQRHHDDQRGHHDRTMMPGDQHPGDRPEQDRDKGAGLDQRIAEHELVRREQIGKDRVFERAEKRRLDPHREQDDEQCRTAAEQHTRCRGHHQHNFAELDRPGSAKPYRAGRRAGRRSPSTKKTAG